jgi:Chaperone of endosialidase
VTSRVQTLRSSTSGSVPAAGTRQPGELWVNFPDLQLGVVDTLRNAQKLVAVRYFSTTAAYATGDFVIQGGVLYIAKGAVAAGAFNATQWSRVAGATDAGGPYLALTGGTLTGALVLSGDPTVGLGAATKQYVDNAPFLPLTGGVMTGAIVLPGPPTLPSQAATKAYVDSGAFVPLAGGTMTGPLTLAADPAANLGAATKQYVDAKASAALPTMAGTAAAGVSALFARGDHVHPTDTSRFAVAGGTITGAVNLTSAATALSINPPAGNGAQILLNKPASGQANSIAGYTNSSIRWQMQLGNGTAESGGNAGSDFGIYRYTDAGALVDAPLAITRSTGQVALTGNLALTNASAAITMSGASSQISVAYLFQAGRRFNFAYNSPLFQVGVDAGATGIFTLVKSFNVATPFTSTIDTMAMNGGGAQIAAWSGGTGGTWSVAISSDRRLKTNLAPPDKDALEAVNAIPVYSCDMTQPQEGAVETHWDWAVIADEVEPQLPLGVVAPNELFPYATMRDYPFIPMLIRAVQQLTEQVEALTARVTELEGKA